MKYEFKLTVLAGFTLVELMVCLLLTGIMLLQATTSFYRIIQQQRITLDLTQLQHAFQFARGQAVVNQHLVLICGSQDKRHCVDDWSRGFIVQARPVMPKQPPVLLYQFRLNNTSARLHWHGFNHKPYVQFDGLGQALASNGRLDYCDSEDHCHQLIINRAGRLRFEKAA